MRESRYKFSTFGTFMGACASVGLIGLINEFLGDVLPSGSNERLIIAFCIGAFSVFVVDPLIIRLRTREIKVDSPSTSVRPPNANRRSFVADFLLPIKLSSDLHANLDEAMPLWIAAHGEPRALWIRRSQESQTIVQYWMTPIKNLFQAVLKVIR